MGATLAILVPAAAHAAAVPFGFSAFFLLVVYVFVPVPPEQVSPMFDRLASSFVVLVPSSFVSAAVGAWRARSRGLSVSVLSAAHGGLVVAVAYSLVAFIFPRSLETFAKAVGLIGFLVGPACWIRYVAARPIEAVRSPTERVK
jgi:hypothetical protein